MTKPNYQPGDRVKIVDVHHTDAHFLTKDKLIGKEVTIEEVRKPHRKGWHALTTTNALPEGGYYFLAIRVRRASQNKGNA